MLTDARTLASGSRFDVDLCIIGGGAAGITIAMELIDSGLRILLVESGGTDPDKATHDLAAGESIGRPATTLDTPVRLDQMRLRYLGGTTNHWAGFCRPLSRIDFEPRDHLRVSGWPITYDDMVPYWERAAEWVRISDGDFSVATWTDRLGLAPPPIHTAELQPFTYQITFPTAFGRIYRADLDASDSVEVLLHANVVNLATDDGRRITGIDVRTLTGVAIEVGARAYVLATGGIENPRLLLASTDADPTGVGNRTDMVGRHFTEHLQVYAGFAVVESSPDELAGVNGAEVTITAGRHAGASHGAKFALGLTDQHLRDAATTGLEVQLLPGSFPLGVPLQDNGIAMTDIGALLAHTGAAPASALYLQTLAEQELDPQSRVQLGRDTDALGMKRVQLDWRYGPADRERVLAGLRLVAETIGASGWGRMQLIPGGVHADAIDHIVPGEILTIYRTDPSAIDLTGFPVGMGFHHMCTTRMSQRPEDGVVDADCRLHEVDNFWIAGSSVFGTGGTATPTYSLVALAVRLADHLGERLA